MCGIVGYVGPREARPLLLAGLEKLEYRGYDSAGISVLNGDRIDAVRAVGNLSALRAAIACPRSAQSPGSAVAVAEPPQPAHRHRPHPLGHPWRGHRAERAPALRHRRPDPRRRQRDRRELRRAERRPARRRRRVHLRDRRRGDRAPDRRPLRQRRPRRRRPRGLRANCAATTRSSRCAPMSPACIVGARNECPLIVGRGDGEQFIASAIPAFLSRHAAGPVHQQRRARRPRRPTGSVP